MEGENIEKLSKACLRRRRIRTRIKKVRSICILSCWKILKWYRLRKRVCDTSGTMWIQKIKTSSNQKWKYEDWQKMPFFRYAREELNFSRALLNFRLAMIKNNGLENKRQIDNCVKCEKQKTNLVRFEKLQIIVLKTLIAPKKVKCNNISKRLWKVCSLEPLQNHSIWPKIDNIFTIFIDSDLNIQHRKQCLSATIEGSSTLPTQKCGGMNILICDKNAYNNEK